MIGLNTKAAQPLSKSQGFTLIELMVTIAVLAIIVGMAAPSVSTQLANQRTKSTAATLENALKEARAESMIQRQNITVAADASGNITIKDAANHEIRSYKINAKNSVTASSVIFEPTKRVTAAVTYTICDQNKSADARQIIVNKLGNITSQLGGSC